MAAFRVNGIQLGIEAETEISCDVRDWVTDPGPTWEGMAIHGTWLYVGKLTFAFPHDPADRLAILERLAAAVETLAADARAQMAPAEAVA